MSSADISSGPDHTAIVVLGAAVWADEMPSPTLSRRIATAVAQYKAGAGAWIVASGGEGRYPPSEAEVMRREFLLSDIPKSAILVEDRSTNTFENAQFSIRLMRDASISHAVVVTDRYHILRAVLTFRLLGMHARGVGARRSTGTPLLRYVWYWVRESVALPVYLVRLLISGAFRRP